MMLLYCAFCCVWLGVCFSLVNIWLIKPLPYEEELRNCGTSNFFPYHLHIKNSSNRIRNINKNYIKVRVVRWSKSYLPRSRPQTFASRHMKMIMKYGSMYWILICYFHQIYSSLVHIDVRPRVLLLKVWMHWFIVHRRWFPISSTIVIYRTSYRLFKFYFTKNYFIMYRDLQNCIPQLIQCVTESNKST